MAIMMSLDHPNIIKLYEVYDQSNCYVMVMELCEGGDLFKKVNQGLIDYQSTISITKQILSALNYIHSQKIVHRDIKLENILYESNTRTIKLIDFGISTKIREEQFLVERIGTPAYIAPEVLTKCYNEKCDLWSLGIAVCVMLTKKTPIQAKDAKDFFHKIMFEKIDLKPFLGYSPQCANFLKKVLTKNYRKRLSAYQALQHPWITKNCGDATLTNSEK